MGQSVSGRTNVFPAILYLQMLGPFMNSNFFKKFLARGARARNYKPLQNEHIFRVLQKVAATKKFFTEIWEMVIEKYLYWQIFCKTLLPTRIWYYSKKERPRWCKHAKILQYFMLMLFYAHQSFFEIWRWLIYGKTSIFDEEHDETKIKLFT